MDKRTKIMASLFGLLVLYTLGSTVVYPYWVEPLVTIGDRIEKKQKELDKLEAVATKVVNAKRSYLRFMDRSGALDIAEIENEVRVRLNKLIDQFRLADAKVSRGRPGLVPKTDISRMVLTIGAEGTLASTIGFLRELYELPHLIRVGNVSLSPLRSGRRKSANAVDLVALRVPLEIWVLPQHRMLGRKIEKEDLVQPERVVRHAGLAYSKIWERTPFMEFVPFPPLKVNLPPAQSVQVGARLQLQGSAQGGDSQYVYLWSPSDGLASPNRVRTNVDTTTPGKLVYTLTVRDNSDHTATATVAVVVTEKPKPPPKVATKSPPSAPKLPPPPDKRKLWPNRNQMRLSMTLSHWQDEQRVDEVLVHNAQTDESSYFSVGDEFDGGELIYIHPRGIITRWVSETSKSEEYFIYPIGSQLSGSLKPADAKAYPYLRLAAMQYQSDDNHAEVAAEITLDESAVETASEEETVNQNAQPDLQDEQAPQPVSEPVKFKGVRMKPVGPKGVQSREAKNQAMLEARRKWDEEHKDDPMSVESPSDRRKAEKRLSRERRRRKHRKSNGRRD